MTRKIQLYKDIFSSIYESVQRETVLELITEMDQQPLLEKPVKQSKFPTRNLFLAVCAVGVGGTFQYGYSTSVINAPSQHIQKFINETWDHHYQTKLDENTLTLMWSVIVSIFTLGGLIGALIGGSLAIKLGRKRTLLANNAFALLASICMGIAYPTGIFELLIVGRFLIGINSGIGLCVQPIYLGESAPKHLRGAMSLSSSIFLTGGILIGQIIGLRELLGGDKHWPILMSTVAIPAIVQLVTLPWCPESPRYLLIDKSKEAECIKALKTFHGAVQYQIEMEDIKKENVVLNGEKPKKTWELFTDRTIKWQLIATILTNSSTQLCGINAIYFYASSLFMQAGIPEENIPYVTLGSGACECITAFVCSLLVEHAGRRILIIGGYVSMAIWCIILTITLVFQKVHPWIPYLSVVCVFAYILSFGIGPGGVTNTLNTELFTQSSRPGALAIGGSVNWISMFTIGIVFPFILSGLNPYSFLVFFVVCSLTAVFIFFVIPETKNKTFLEIKENFKRLNGNDQTVVTNENEGNITIEMQRAETQKVFSIFRRQC